MVYKGRLKVAGDPGEGIPVDLSIDDVYVDLVAGDEALGRWRMDLVEVSRMTGNEFSLVLDGERMLFVAADPLGFVYNAVTTIEEISGRLRRRRGVFRKRVPSTPRRAVAEPAPNRVTEVTVPTPVVMTDLEDLLPSGPELGRLLPPPPAEARPSIGRVPGPPTAEPVPEPPAVPAARPIPEPVPEVTDMPESVDPLVELMEAGAAPPVPAVPVDQPPVAVPEMTPVEDLATPVEVVEVVEVVEDVAAVTYLDDDVVMAELLTVGPLHHPDSVQDTEAGPTDATAAVSEIEMLVEAVASGGDDHGIDPGDPPMGSIPEVMVTTETPTGPVDGAGPEIAAGSSTPEPEPEPLEPVEPEAPSGESSAVDEGLAPEELPESPEPLDPLSEPVAPREPMLVFTSSPSSGVDPTPAPVTSAATPAPQGKQRRFGRSKAADEHEHEYAESRTVGGITRRVCAHCGHVSFAGEDVYQEWT